MLSLRSLTARKGLAIGFSVKETDLNQSWKTDSGIYNPTLRLFGVGVYDRG